MHIDTTATTLDKTGIHIRLRTTPDMCPRCHRNVHPQFISAHRSIDSHSCQGVFRCTHHHCAEIFIGNYRMVSAGNRPEYSLKSIAPFSAKRTAFPEHIQSISPTFCEIHAQAEHAEAEELEQLVGIGLRKALEFLIKDYACSENRENEIKIRSSLLAPCINQYINDTNVKECAKRAAWLGNDETHYTRKWETKDVNDLKLLVRLTANWIENSLLTKHYISEMQAGK